MTEDADTDRNIDEPEADVFLTLLMKTLIGHDLEASFNVTLTIGGAVVSGYVRSHEAYVRALPDLLEEGGLQAEVVQAFRDGLADATATYLEAEAAMDPDEVPDPRYIVLANAKVRQGTFTTSLRWWRGRLSEVDGWALGAE